MLLLLWWVILLRFQNEALAGTDSSDMVESK